LRLAADLVNNHTFPGDPKIIAERYGWIAVAIIPFPVPSLGLRAALDEARHRAALCLQVFGVAK
jgi:hypothetical protein